MSSDYPELTALLTILRSHPGVSVEIDSTGRLFAAGIVGFDQVMNAVYRAGWVLSLEDGTVQMRRHGAVFALTGVDVVERQNKQIEPMVSGAQ